MTDVPIALIRAFAEMLPRLEAEEALGQAQRTAVGTGSVDTQDQRRIQGDWMRAARPVATQPQRPASPEVLAAMGIGVRVVTKTT